MTLALDDNIQHLFTGLVLVTIGAVPLALLLAARVVDSTVRAAVFGIGLSLAFDEWVT